MDCPARRSITLGGTPNADALSETYNSVAPYRWGDYSAKYRLVPIAPDQRALTGQTVEAADRPDAIREDVCVEMARLDAEWEFQVQLCRNLENWDPAQLCEIDQNTRFSIWTELAAHQPLGNINRARNETYRHSADYRV